MDIPPIESIAESIELANEGVFEEKIGGRNPGQASAPEDLTSASLQVRSCCAFHITRRRLL